MGMSDCDERGRRKCEVKSMRVSWGEEGLWSGDQGCRTDEINKQMDDIATTTARC